ncbi:hypothetical protein CWI36_0578p0010 [Hamiltosporidium magnivora]|uniref:Uncharacterized protein n=1 Tax=Hamiltosporidium magnivora TaxID=148818 RepID=A0A4Q9LDZ4_9MICR|nr:hypothetical protein CWI36_0578p0010 [Hamiltosporidium magnivora]
MDGIKNFGRKECHTGIFALYVLVGMMGVLLSYIGGMSNEKSVTVFMTKNSIFLICVFVSILFLTNLCFMVSMMCFLGNIVIFLILIIGPFPFWVLFLSQFRILHLIYLILPVYLFTSILLFYYRYCKYIGITRKYLRVSCIILMRNIFQLFIFFSLVFIIFGCVTVLLFYLICRYKDSLVKYIMFDSIIILFSIWSYFICSFLLSTLVSLYIYYKMSTCLADDGINPLYFTFRNIKNHLNDLFLLEFMNKVRDEDTDVSLVPIRHKLDVFVVWTFVGIICNCMECNINGMDSWPKYFMTFYFLCYFESKKHFKNVFKSINFKNIFMYNRPTLLLRTFQFIVFGILLVCINSSFKMFYQMSIMERIFCLVFSFVFLDFIVVVEDSIWKCFVVAGCYDKELVDSCLKNSYKNILYVKEKYSEKLFG